MTTLASSKRFGTSYEDQKNHAWGANRAALANVSDWVGKRVGIAGYGSIGRQGEFLLFETFVSPSPRSFTPVHVFPLPVILTLGPLNFSCPCFLRSGSYHPCIHGQPALNR